MKSASSPQSRLTNVAARTRSRRAAAMLTLMIMIAGLLLLPMAVFGFHCVWLFQQKLRIQSTIDAAALVAAKDLSRIYIDDQFFGLVGVGNFPPVGKATMAGDGEPLPVWSINNLVGTLRLSSILAQELQSDAMDRLVGLDYEHLKATTRNLNETIVLTIREKDSQRFADINGAKIAPANDVKSFAVRELHGLGEIKSLELSNGWLSQGGPTTIAIPGSAKEANISGQFPPSGEYTAFTDFPAQGRSFLFAAVAKSPRLADSRQFCSADDKHVCTVVKVRTIVQIHDPLARVFGELQPLEFNACALPYSLADVSPPGVLTLRFPRGFVNGIDCLADLISSNNTFVGPVSSYEPSGGDYPIDERARLNTVIDDSSPGDSSAMFARSLYFWLRNGHCYPRIEAVLAALRKPVTEGPARFLIYEFQKDGSIAIKPAERDPFAEGMVSEQQRLNELHGQSHSGILCSCFCRNQTERIGATSGGKHAGQPLNGYPLDWSELAQYCGNEYQALAAGKGKFASQLTVVASNAPAHVASMLTILDRAQMDSFQKLDGTPMPQQPRRSIYSGGLATDIEISIVRKPFLLKKRS